MKPGDYVRPTQERIERSRKHPHVDEHTLAIVLPQLEKEYTQKILILDDFRVVHCMMANWRPV